MVSMEIANQFYNQNISLLGYSKIIQLFIHKISIKISDTVIMSQFWHANWAEDAFKPTRLQNWEVPRWHPEWPERHCATTKFEAHSNGRVYATFQKSDNPWGYYKGTWELPLKINRTTAEKLSKFTELKRGPWEALVKKYRCECDKTCKESIKEAQKIEKNQSQIEKKKDSDKKAEKMKHDIQTEKTKMDKEFGKMCYVKQTCTL